MDGKLDAGCLAERLTGLQNEYWLHLDAKSPLEKYPAKQHARRVQEKLGVDEGLIYLPGEVARNNTDSDMPAPFRQRRYFYYLSGCNEPGCHLTYDIETDTLALFIPRIDPRRVIWYGRGSTPAEALDKYDIDQVFYVDQLQDFLQNWAKFYRGSLYILGSDQSPQIPGLHEQIDADSLRPAVDLARVVKDEHEIRLIKKANDISSRAHKVVLANILRFKNEAQVEGLFLNVCISKQAKQQAYDIIAASGPNAGTLHYDSNDEDFEDRQLMCLDAGCEYELYASDITRTFPLSGNWPSVVAKDISQLVQRMQETCIQGLKPGVRYLDLHILAHQIAIDGLLSLGILHNGTREEIYKAGTSMAFFPHGLGHHVGLEVHDVGHGELMSMTKGNPKYEMAPSVFPKDYHLSVYDPELCRSPVDTLSGHLEEGMVVTVEPGIYFSAYSLNTFYLPSPVHSKYINVAAVKRYLPVGGVRIEDDLLITRKGYENLTTAPKGEAMLEIIRSQNAQWPFISESSDLGPTAREEADNEQPLLRAPGLPRHTPEPIPKPLARSSTAPVQRRRDGRAADAVDFEPFNGPSLYTNFKRSRTTDENVQRWKDSSRARSTRSIKNDIGSGPMCGESLPAFTHAYLDFPTESRSGLGSGPPRPQAEKKPACKKCTILVEALDRLRDNLNKSEQNSPRPSAKAPRGGMFAGEEKMLFTEPLPIRTARAVPSVGLGVVTDALASTDNAMNKNFSMVPVADTPGHVHPFPRGPVSRASLPIIKSPQAQVDSQALFELSGGQGKVAPAERACKHCERRKLVCRPVHSLPACGECVLGFRAWDCDVAEKSHNPTTPTKPAISAEMLARMMQTPPPSNQSVAPETGPAPPMHIRLEKSCIHCRRSKVNCTWEPSSQACRACIASDRPCIVLDARNDPDSRISALLVPSNPNPAKVSNRDFRASLPAVIDSRYASFQPRATYSSPEPVTALTATPTASTGPPTTAYAQGIRPPPISVSEPCSLCTTLCTPCHRTTRSGACQTCTLNGFLCPDAPATETLKDEVRHRCRTCHKRRMTCHGFSFYGGCKCCERDGFVCEMPSVRGMYLNGLGVELRARALMGAVQGSVVQPREDAGDQGKENLPWGGRD